MDQSTLTFKFVLGWVLMITLLTLLNKTRLGHVAIYYALLLIILLILVTEYKQIAPLLSSVMTIGELSASSGVVNASVVDTGHSEAATRGRA